MNTNTNPPSTPGAIRRSLSISMIENAFYKAWNRFPVTVVFIFLASVWTIFINHNVVDRDAGIFAPITYFTTVGILLTFAINIWCEFRGFSTKIPIIVAILLLTADSIYIYFCEPSFNSAWSLSRTALVTALLVATLFVPVRKSWAWNYTGYQLYNLAVCIIYFFIVLIAASIIFTSIHLLFLVNPYDFFTDILVVFGGIIPAIMFLARSPERSEPEEMEKNFKASGFQSGSAKYFLLPITLIYMAILYVYGINILFHWELPHGIVCWSVTGLTAFVFVTGFFLEGVRRTYPDDTITVKALRYLPVAMLPLLVLMSVAVLYRIGQYGLTVSRLYVLTFNIWAYCMMIYWYLRQPRTFNFAAISFAIVFVATSIFPYANYKTITDNIMRNRMMNLVTAAGLNELPASKDEFIKAFSTLDLDQRKDLKSILEYLGEDEAKKVVKIPAEEYYYVFIYNLNDDDITVSSSKYEDKRYSDEFKMTAIPDGFTFVKVASSDYKLPKEFNHAEPCITVDDVNYAVPADSIAALTEDEFIPFYIRPVSGSSDSIFMVNYIYIDYNMVESEKADTPVYDRINTSGILFTK